MQPALPYFSRSASDTENLWFSSNNSSLTLSPSHAFYPFVKREKKEAVINRSATREKTLYDEDDESRRWPRLSYPPTCSSKDAQVAEGSFDLSTACPAGYVPFLSRTFCLFSRRRNSSKTRRFKGGGVAPTPAPTPAIHFAAFWENERINKWHLMGKRFKRTPLRGNETDAREAGGGGFRGVTLERRGSERERDRGRKRVRGGS